VAGVTGEAIRSSIGVVGKIHALRVRPGAKTLPRRDLPARLCLPNE